MDGWLVARKGSL